MTKYQASKRVILGSIFMGFILRSCTATRMPMGPAAIGSLGQLCSPDFIRGTNIMGSIGINGAGGIGSGFNPRGPTLCIKQGSDASGVMGGIKITPEMSRVAHEQAIQSLLRLQAADCKTAKVSPKAQACFLLKAIQKKARRPEIGVTSSRNAIFLKKRNKVSAMLLVERFGSLAEKKKPVPTIEQVIGKPTYSVTLNEFDDVLKKEGTPSKSKSSKCADCLKHLKTDITMGDPECGMCSDTISFDLGNII